MYASRRAAQFMQMPTSMRVSRLACATRLFSLVIFTLTTLFASLGMKQPGKCCSTLPGVACRCTDTMRAQGDCCCRRKADQLLSVAVIESCAKEVATCCSQVTSVKAKSSAARTAQAKIQGSGKTGPMSVDSCCAAGRKMEKSDLELGKSSTRTAVAKKSGAACCDRSSQVSATKSSPESGGLARLAVSPCPCGGESQTWLVGAGQPRIVAVRALGIQAEFAAFLPPLADVQLASCHPSPPVPPPRIVV